MVKLKFIILDNALVLRISENKERFYKSTKHLLKDNPNLEKHWNADIGCYTIFRTMIFHLPICEV